MDNVNTSDARLLLEKMKINPNEANAVDKFIASSGATLDAKVVHVLKRLVAKVGNPQAAPMAISKAVAVSLTPIPFRVAVTSLNGGAMIGGGVNVSAKYIQMTDYLRNQLEMVGGSPTIIKTSKYLRVAYEDLKNALKSKNKQIDDIDNARISDLINNLERTEQKVEKAFRYIIALRKLLNNPNFNAESGIKGNVTAKMMEELEETHRKLTSSATKKSGDIMSVLNSIHTAVGDIPEMKKDIAALKKSAGLP
jgi:hypothetical protein